MDEIMLKANAVIKLMPIGAVRRNSQYYELLTYLNHTVAFYILERYDEAIVFLVRGIKLCKKKCDLDSSNFTVECYNFFEFMLLSLKEKNLISKKSVNYLKNTLH